MKRILNGYRSFFRELFNRPNDGSFLSLPAGPGMLIVVCGMIGLLRNALSVGFGILPGFYNFQPDILWTMFNFPVYLWLFSGAFLHWQLHLLGYRHVRVESVLGLAFHLQILHLIVPLLDWLGHRLGMPWSYMIGAEPVATEWYTNLLFMTPGIVAGWWITAYMIARVFRQRLEIPWYATVLTSLSTFLIIAIPTYVFFPAFNTIFNRTFGPWLWNPLDYLFVTPKWFPFWGYGTYFALSTLFGLVYYLRRRSEQHILLPTAIRRIWSQGVQFWSRGSLSSILGLKEILIGVALISITRTTVDIVLWHRTPSLSLWLLTCLLWFFYILSLCFSTAFLLSRLVRGSEFRQVATMAVCVYWIIALVPFFSLLPWEKAWGLGIFATIPFFKWIPTFLVERNYLPLGMLVVSPIILLMSSRHVAKTTGTPWWRALVSTLVAFALIYVYYYQWSQRAMATAFFEKEFAPWEALVAGYVVYSFLSQAITFLLSPVIARSYEDYPLWMYALWSGVPLFILLIAPRVGVVAVFLAGGQP